MTSLGTVSMPLFRGILEAAKRHGLDAATALAAVDIDSDVLTDSDRRVPRPVLYRLWEELGERANDPDLGLHFAESAAVGDFAVLDYAMRNSPTLGEAYQQATRYGHVLHNGVDVFATVSDGAASMRYKEPARSPRQIAEWVVALWLVVGRQILGEEWKPTQVSFQHAAPEDTSEHRRVFGCTPTFRAPHNELVFDAKLLERPVVAADPQLFEVVSRFARQLLDQVPRAETTRDQVMHVIADVLGRGESSLETVARRLAMAPRTLQRKLKAEGVSFQSLNDEVRCDLAKRYLGDRTLAVEETAFLLGFSEPSAFNRAFKRWTGDTPSAYRPVPP